MNLYFKNYVFGLQTEREREKVIIQANQTLD